MVAEQQLALIIEARDRATANMRAIGQQMGNMDKMATGLRTRFLSLSAALGFTGISVYALGRVFRGYISGLREASQASKDLQNRMLLMGFGLDQTSRAVDVLRNNLDRTAFVAMAGMSAETAHLLGMLGADAQQQVAQMTSALVNLGTEPKATLAALTEAQHENFTKISELLGRTVHSWEELDAAVTTATIEARKQMTDLDLAMENLGSTWETSMKGIGPATETGLAAIVNLAARGVEWYQSLLGDTFKFTDAIADAFYKAGGSWKGALAVAWTGIKILWGTALMVLRERWDTFWGALTGTISAIFRGISNAIATWWQGTVLTSWHERMAEARNVWGLTWRWITESVPNWFTSIGAAIASWWTSTIMPVWETITAWIQQKWDALWEAIKNSPLVSFISGAAETVGGWLSGIKQAISNVGGALGFQQGGMVPGPVGAPRLAVVHGGEQVIPAGGHAGTTVINIQVGDHVLKRLILDVLGGEIRVREPGLGMG